MERIDHFSITHCGTTINLSKKPLCTIADEVNLLLLGKHEQRLLKNPSSQFGRSFIPGRLFYPKSIFYKKNDCYDSNSDDDNYKPFSEDNRVSLCKKIDKKSVNNAMSITEPRISQTNWNRDNKTNQPTPTYDYRVMRQDPMFQLYDTCKFNGNEAITEAAKDLASCYQVALTKGIEHLSDEKEKSIALATLSADVGFPREKAAPIAVREILAFVRKNPKAYDRIELFVKKRSEFKLYKKLLDEYWQKPRLLILAHKDENHFLHNVPREILDSILQLMHPITYYR
jgi:hypothetical protein